MADLEKPKKPTKRVLLKEQGTVGLSTSNGRIYEGSLSELDFPNSINTYKTMKLDPAVSSGMGVLELLAKRAKWKVIAPHGASDADTKRAEKLNKRLANMDRPFNEYINEFLSLLTYGFHIAEKNWIKDKDGDFVWKSLPTRSQDTVNKWLWSDDGRKLIGVEQDLSLVCNDYRLELFDSTKIQIHKDKFLLFRHDPKRDNPQGKSLLSNVYVPWKYKNQVEQYESIGVSKDLGGIVEVRIPAEYIAKYNEDPTSDEGVTVQTMLDQAKSLHAGEETSIMLPSDYDETTKTPLFDFKLKGIEGGGKQYSTQDIINRYSNEILIAFFADILKLGNDSHGSFALADSKSSLLTLAVASHLDNIKGTLNNDLMKETYELNGWGEWSEETSAQFIYEDLDDPDKDDIGKYVQRIMSVGGMRPSEELERALYGVLGMDVSEDKKLTYYEVESGSRAGESKGSSGTGGSQKGGGNSSTNSENA